MWIRLPEDASVEFRLDPVAVELAPAFGRPPLRNTVGSQIGQAWPKAGINISLQDFRGGVDVRISVVHA